MLKLFNDLGIALIENVFIPCFGADTWLAWVTLLTILIMCTLCIICIVLVVKNNKLKEEIAGLNKGLEDACKTVDTKSTQINQLTENLSVIESELKTANNIKAELEAQLTSTKEEYEKELTQLKLEIEGLKAVDTIVEKVKEVEAVVENTVSEEIKEGAISEVVTEVKKKKSSSSSKSKKTKNVVKKEEEIKEEAKF